HARRPGGARAHARPRPRALRRHRLPGRSRPPGAPGARRAEPARELGGRGLLPGRGARALAVADPRPRAAGACSPSAPAWATPRTPASAEGAVAAPGGIGENRTPAPRAPPTPEPRHAHVVRTPPVSAAARPRRRARGRPCRGTCPRDG